MRFPGFIGPSYTLASVNYECQRTVNLYPELDELGTGKDREVGMLIGTPGITQLASIGSGPIRGMWFSSSGLLFVVSGNTLYSVSSSWVATSIGTLATYSGQVSMCDNGLQLFITDGTSGYYVTLLTPTTLTQVNQVQWLGSKVVLFMDGYFIFVQPDTAQFYLSDLNDVTFVAPAITGKNGYPDKLVTAIANSRNLWLFGETSTEVWFDAGSNNNPFQYISGTLSQVGCAAAFSVAKIANQICWLGKDPNGSGIVFTNNNYTPARISTLAVEKAIQSYSVISDAIGFAYQENGHEFYVLTFPTANATWCFDLSTKMWHERCYLSNGVEQRIRANCYAFAYGVHVVGDYSTGSIYNQSLSIYSDNGSAILRQRVTPHVSQDMNRLFFSRLQLDIESGVGLDGALTTQGSTPQAMLEWSDDGGHTWSNQHWTNFGVIGATRKRAIWRRLGQSRNRVFRASITDPVKVILMGAELDVVGGAS